MKRISVLFLSVLTIVSVLYAQRDYRVHRRSMLHQTIYNTGEIGRALDANASTTNGVPKLPEGSFPATLASWEWPPFGYQILDGIEYWGHHNSFGAGILFSADIPTTTGVVNVRRACGAVTDGAGNSTQVAGIYVVPGSITRTENYPVLADGSLNPNYNPNEAEEIITTTYRTTDPMKLQITQTSRAWSYPGYDSFIIIEYEIVNVDTVDYTNGFVMFGEAIAPSAFGMQRKYALWNESSNTTRAQEVYARYNFTRYLSYVHTRNGFPDKDYFNMWSTPGNRGGLNAPQAVGYMILRYDTNNIQTKDMFTYARSDSAVVWDEQGRFKQPWITQQIPNRNQDLSDSRLGALMMISNRPFSGFDFRSGRTDSTNWANFYYPYASVNPAKNLELMKYWHGRIRPRATGTGNYSQTTLHYTTFGPYVFKKNVRMKFAIAQLVGYGPGIATDTVYRDAGGFATETGYSTGGFKPVVSWYDSISYPGIHATFTHMGSAYLKTHPLPWYVTGKISNLDPEPVISLRQVADRAIQMYTGQPYKNYNEEQYKPEYAPASGVYKSAYIPIPAPAIDVYNAADMKNKIVWSPSVEDFTSLSQIRTAIGEGRVRSGLKHYLVLKAEKPLGPWKVLDSVKVRDPRYFNADIQYPGYYVVRDTSSLLNENYFYCVVSVDSTGGRSGMTNITYHATQKGAVSKLSKVYVAPNPLILTANFGGYTTQGDIYDKIGFFGLSPKCDIRIFSYSGQLIATIHHRSDTYSTEWFQISRSEQRIASGVYFYVVEDLVTGDRVHGKFVIIH
ncbi:MAG: T9SS C-terminal target domain-containing protein [Bacteroidetes bacterium]|nr:T9SS C-terminal target domain-containing protein [Bacteroidota bacterium]